MIEQVLVIGRDTHAHHVYKGDSFNLVDGNALAASGKPFEPSTYDIVVLDNILQQMDRGHVGAVISMYQDALVDGGLMVLVVPALEWAGAQVAMHMDPPLSAFLALFGEGGDGAVHKCGFTMPWLRLNAERTGLTVIDAHTEAYKMFIAEKEEETRQHVLIGRYRRGNPADAV